MELKNYSDFVTALLDAGFSMGGGNSEGIFAVVPFSWTESPSYETPVRWHTGEPETDPWEWRIRVLDERDDIAYAKLFFRKSGYITKEWYPYFLAVRRNGISFEEEYAYGTISQSAKRIYCVIKDHEVLPLHAIKELSGFGKDEKSKFERALVDLQMKMYITMCGRQQKISQQGNEYGWSSTVFCQTESFFGEDVFQKANKISATEAIEIIKDRICDINPDAEDKKIIKFIRG